MVNTLPAVLIGGPPHAGKSVLTYNLSQALRRQNVPHYVLRASPDGEGDWSQEMNQNTAQLIRVKGDWTPEFVSRVCADLERRQLPLLVDPGGKPRDEQMCIFKHCTDAILLLHANDKQTSHQWHELVKINNLTLLAHLYSQQNGASMLSSNESIIDGTLVGLERGTQHLQGQLFDALVERIQSLFLSVIDPVKMHLEAVSAEQLVNLDSLLRNWMPPAKEWTSEMMRQLLTDLPAHTPLSVYGRGPNWLYGALAAHGDIASFYQFNSRLGWVTPPPLELSTREMPEVHITSHRNEDTTILKIEPKYLDYSLCNNLAFPPVPLEHGLIIDGALPQWLLTALVRLYKGAGVAWIAYRYLRDEEGRAIVMTSRTDVPSLGDLVPLFIP